MENKTVRYINVYTASALTKNNAEEYIVRTKANKLASFQEWYSAEAAGMLDVPLETCDLVMFHFKVKGGCSHDTVKSIVLAVQPSDITDVMTFVIPDNSASDRASIEGMMQMAYSALAFKSTTDRHALVCTVGGR